MTSGRPTAIPTANNTTSAIVEFILRRGRGVLLRRAQFARRKRQTILINFEKTSLLRRTDEYLARFFLCFRGHSKSFYRSINGGNGRKHPTFQFLIGPFKERYR